jgi:hypothetical protein
MIGSRYLKEEDHPRVPITFSGVEYGGRTGYCFFFTVVRRWTWSERVVFLIREMCHDIYSL